MDGYGYDVITVIFIVIVLLARLLWWAASKEAEPTERRGGADETEDETQTSRTYQLPTPSRVRPLILALKDHDWEKRSAAALALGTMGDKTAVEPLAKTLLYDKSDVVRENAALSLAQIGGGKALDPLIKVVDGYLQGTEKATRAVVASAVSLGEIGNPRALECLKQLDTSLDKAGLSKESKAVSQAIQKIKSTTKLAGKSCAVCNLPFKKGDDLVRCPSCGNAAHRTHMLEWLHVKDSCPVCQEHLSESDLEEVNSSYLPRKERRSS